jgi:hypothetical protein
MLVGEQLVQHLVQQGQPGHVLVQLGALVLERGDAQIAFAGQVGLGDVVVGPLLDVEHAEVLMPRAW